MAEIQPLRALRYDQARTNGLQPVVAPPYDVIDDAGRAELLAGSSLNVVEIDLPRDPAGGDPYTHAAAVLEKWRTDRVIVQDNTDALWPLAQEYTGPDGVRRTRTGFLARVRVEDYGSGRIRPHERTHPGPKEDRLRLTRATRANLSPIFSLYSDPAGTVAGVLGSHTAASEPWAETIDPDGTVNRLWRVDDGQAIDAVREAMAEAELLIADGHHRYETARVYAREQPGPGGHDYVLMCLVALEDPGLTVFPTHRLLRNLTREQQLALGQAIRRDFEVEELESTAELAPAQGDGVRLGYIDAHHRQPYRLTLKDPAIADAALPDRAEPYRRLDTAVLEALILKGTLGMSDDDIDHLKGLGYAKSDEDALALVTGGNYDAAFFMAPTPVERIQQVAAAGESMPPKSTFFYPKVPTGLLFNPLT